MEAWDYRQDKDKKDYYNNIPVFYCTNCSSLHIASLLGEDYCKDCGSTQVKQCSIEEWEELKK